MNIGLFLISIVENTVIIYIIMKKKPIGEAWGD